MSDRLFHIEEINNIIIIRPLKSLDVFTQEEQLEVLNNLPTGYTYQYHVGREKVKRIQIETKTLKHVDFLGD